MDSISQCQGIKMCSVVVACVSEVSLRDFVVSP